MTEPQKKVLNADELAALEIQNQIRNRLADEAAEVYMLLEMSQDTGRQTLVAAPNSMMPVRGVPLLTACMEQEAREDVEDGAPVYLMRNKGLVKDTDIPQGCYTIDAVMQHDDGTLPEEWVVVTTLEQFNTLCERVDSRGRLWCMGTIAEDGTLIYQQARDANGELLYHSHALIFPSREYAEEWIKERGLKDHAYMILHGVGSITGERDPMEVAALDAE